MFASIAFEGERETGKTVKSEEKCKMEKTDRKLWRGRSGGVCGYPRGDRKFLGNFSMISGRFPTIYRKFPGSRGMSPVTESHMLKR